MSSKRNERDEQQLLALLRAEERMQRIERGRTDPAWWLKHYLRHHFASSFGRHHVEMIRDFQEMVEATADSSDISPTAAPEDWWTLDTSVAEDEGCSEEQWLEAQAREEVEQVPRSAAYSCPREHGKSTLMVGLTLWAVVHRLKHYVLFVSDVSSQATDRLGEALAELERNGRIREDYGEQVGQKRWTTTDSVTSTGIRLRAFGTRSNIRGAKHGARRPDLVLVDDGENDEFVDTEAQRQKTRDWLLRVLTPAVDSDSGVMVVTGTVLHHDSLLARLVSSEHFLGWRKRRYKALLPTDEPGEFQALWPARWPVPKLLAKKRQMGSIAFEAEYGDSPVSDETSRFPLPWLYQCRDQGRPFAGSWPEVMALFGGKAPRIVVSAWDFGWVSNRQGAKERDTDYTVGIAVAVHPETKHRWVLRICRDRGLSPAQIKTMIRSEATRVRPPAGSGTTFKVGVESVGLQEQLYAIGLRQESDLPVTGIKTGREKMDVYTGIPALSALFEGGQYHLPWPMEQTVEAARERNLVQALTNELHGLGHEAHDDLVLALWFTEVLISQYLLEPHAPSTEPCLPLFFDPHSGCSPFSGSPGSGPFEAGMGRWPRDTSIASIFSLMMPRR